MKYYLDVFWLDKIEIIYDSVDIKYWWIFDRFLFDWWDELILINFYFLCVYVCY